MDLISILYQPTRMGRLGESSTQKILKEIFLTLSYEGPRWGLESHGRVHSMAMSKVTLFQSNSLIDWTNTWMWEKSGIQCTSTFTINSVRTSSHCIFTSYEQYFVLWFQNHREKEYENKIDVGKLSYKYCTWVVNMGVHSRHESKCYSSQASPMIKNVFF